MRRPHDVAFTIRRFAFPAQIRPGEAYMPRHEEQRRTSAAAWLNPGVIAVTFIARLLSRRRSGSIANALERQRLNRTMPGQTGAVLASRHGLFV